MKFYPGKIVKIRKRQREPWGGTGEYVPPEGALGLVYGVSSDQQTVQVMWGQRLETHAVENLTSAN